MLCKLIRSEAFEKFLHTRYVGHKRFSLEGAETLIPLLDMAVEHAGQQGLDKIVIGMAHRGRLNVLANVMGKPYRAIFHEFAGGASNPEDVGGSVASAVTSGRSSITTLTSSGRTEIPLTPLTPCVIDASGAI